MFFKEFFIVFASLRNERNNGFFMALSRRRLDLSNHNDHLFFEFVTTYAFDFILKAKSVALNCSYIVTASEIEGEYVLEHDGRSYSCTTDSCTCSYVKKLGLPCRHLFYLREHLGVSMYSENGIISRWTRREYIKDSTTKSEDRTCQQTVD